MSEYDHTYEVFTIHGMELMTGKEIVNRDGLAFFNAGDHFQHSAATCPLHNLTDTPPF